jgi:hypothetical protein
LSDLTDRLALGEPSEDANEFKPKVARACLRRQALDLRGVAARSAPGSIVMKPMCPAI